MDCSEDWPGSTGTAPCAQTGMADKRPWLKINAQRKPMKVWRMLVVNLGFILLPQIELVKIVLQLLDLPGTDDLEPHVAEFGQLLIKLHGILGIID
mgnify:CR=1 FL=1